MLRSISEKQAAINLLKSQIERIQEKCHHPTETLEKEYDGSSGWDYEKYWARFCCGRCGKRWTVDSKDVEEYNRKADIIKE